MWFDTFADLGRVLAVGTAAYLVLVLILRVSGKRTLAKLNAFDLVVTVALGSTLATILLNSTVSWSEGALAMALLALLQTVVAALSARMARLRDVMTSRPAIVLRNGTPLEHVMQRERLALADVRQAVRRSGSGDLQRIAAVVLETDGSLSVVPNDKLGNGSALRDVQGTSDLSR